MAAEEILSDLKGKIRKMITLLQRCIAETNELKEKLKEKEELIRQRETALKNMETKYETLKLAKSISGVSPGNEGARDKINVIIRDLDRCIGLLNR